MTTAPFSLWPAQVDVLAQMHSDSLLAILKARQLGVSWLACAYALWLCLSRANTPVFMFSQGQTESNELIRRVGFLHDNHQDRDSFPKLIKDNTEGLAWDNGSRIMSMPATKRAGRTFSASLIVLDEFAYMLFGGELFTAAKPTIDDGGKMFVISTADGLGTPFHRFWQAAKSGTNKFKTLFLPWTARPDRPADFREQKALEAFDIAQIKREYPENDIEAFTNASGLVFDVWSDGPATGNVTEAAEYMAGAGPVLWLVDDGYSGKLDPNTGQYTADSHPRVFLLVQEKGDGHLDIFFEHYAVHKLSDDHIREVQALAYPAPEYAIIGPGAAELSGRLFAASVYSRKIQADVEETIKEARRLLAPDSNGWRRIRVHPRCRHARAEMVSYRRDPTTEKVVKQNDHGPDVIRYLAQEKRHG